MHQLSININYFILLRSFFLPFATFGLFCSVRYLTHLNLETFFDIQHIYIYIQSMYDIEITCEIDNTNVSPIFISINSYIQIHYRHVECVPHSK